MPTQFTKTTNLPAQLSMPAASPVIKPATLLNREDLRSRGIRYSNPHLIELERRKRFPGRIYLSPAKVAWVEAEVEQWLNDRIDARNSALVTN